MWKVREMGGARMRTGVGEVEEVVGSENGSNHSKSNSIQRAGRTEVRHPKERLASKGLEKVVPSQ